MTKVKHIPERSCVACGRKFPKGQLVRVVRSPQGAVALDRQGRAAGRGAYLCWSPACWQRGIQKGGLERSLKQRLSTQDRQQLLAALTESVTGPLGEERY